MYAVTNDTFAGDEIQVIYETGTDTTPLASSSYRLHNGFNGFKI